MSLQLKRNGEKIEVKVMPTAIPSKDTGIYLGTRTKRGNNH